MLAGVVRHLVGEPVEARDAVVLRHRVHVARVVVRLRERGRDVLHVRDQLVGERHDQPEVGHRLDRVARGGDDVEVRAAGAQLREQLVVGAEARDRHLRPVLRLVGLVVRGVGVVDPVREQQVAALDLAVGGRRRLGLPPPRSPPPPPPPPPPLAAARAAAGGEVGGHGDPTAGEQRLAARDHALRSARGRPRGPGCGARRVGRA